MVQGGDGEVGDMDKHRLSLAALGLGRVDGEEDSLETRERGWERGRQAEEVERREEREEGERGEAEVGVLGEERVVEPVAGGVVGAAPRAERPGEGVVGGGGAEEGAGGAVGVRER